MQETDLLDKIQKKMPDLSKGQRRIAEFIIEHYDKAVYLTATKLGEIVGVSESTIVRFATEMGYEGYPGFQKALEELVKNNLTASQRIQVSSNRISKGSKDILDTILQNDISRIQDTLNYIDRDSFEDAVESILNAERIYIVGGRSSMALSVFLSFYLNFMMDNVIDVNSTTATEIFESIYRINEKDVLIGISFPRYSQRTIKAMEYARSKNAAAIAITDSTLSPLLRFSSSSLIAKSDMASFIDSLAAPLSVINALLVAISVRKKDELTNTLDNLEKIWNEYQVYTSSFRTKYL